MRRSDRSFDKSLGANLRRVRQSLGWSQEQMPRLCNEQGLADWSRSTQAAVETGRRSLLLQEALLLCKAMGVSLPELVDDVVDSEVCKVFKKTASGHLMAPPREANLELVSAEKKRIVVRLRINEATLDKMARRLWKHNFDRELLKRLDERPLPPGASPRTAAALNATAWRVARESMERELKEAMQIKP